MSKMATYHWRLDADLKQRLEAAAREAGTSVADVIERAVEDWLGRPKAPASGPAAGEAEPTQEQLQRRVGNLLDSLPSIEIGDGPYTNAKVREVIGSYLEEKAKRRAPPNPD